MKRLSTALAVVLAAACGGTTKPAIQVFVAQPGQVSLGGTTYLVVAASPANATLTIDNGVGDVTGQTQVAVSPTADTTYTLTAKLGSASVTATVAVHVTAARPSAFKVEPTTAGPVVAGAAATYFVSAVDAAGAVNPNYRGTVHFISDDPKAVVPADATFSAANAGKVSAVVTFKTAGSRSLVAIDSSVSTAQGAMRAVVSPAAAASLALSGVPDAPTAGDRLAVVVTALDAFSNVATGYTGTVHFTSSDATARLPADTTFTAADKGARPFGAAFTKVAPATITVAATVAGVTGASGALSVKHAAASAVTLEGVPATVKADSAVVVTVTVRDAYANPITDYAGTLHFILTDLKAAAIPDLPFTPAMLGTANVTVHFATAKDQSIIVTSVDDGTTRMQLTTKHGK